MFDKDDWRNAMRAIKERTAEKIDLESPQICVHGWWICAEKTKRFRSVVLKRVDGGIPPYRPPGARDCQSKEWKYRVDLTPSALASFVRELDRAEEAIFGRGRNLIQCQESRTRTDLSVTSAQKPTLHNNGRFSQATEACNGGCNRLRKPVAIIDELTDKIPAELLKQSGKVFYSGRLAFAGPAPLYLLGVNPGGDPANYIAETLSNHTKTVLHDHREDWSAYRDESWEGHLGGTHGMAPRVRHLFDRLHLEPGTVPASNLVFVRSRREADIKSSFVAIADQCWPFHALAIQKLQPRVIVCMGRTAGNYVRARLGAKRLIGEFVEKNDRRWRSRLFAGASGPRVVVATHPSIADWTAPSTDPSSLISIALAPACWPIAQLTAEWVWHGESHPQVGEIVGWSWERLQVAVVTMLDDGPKIIIELRPMPENWRRARVVDVANGKEHESVLWYKRWHRVGEKTVDGKRAVFDGRCSIIIQSKQE